MGLSHEAPSDSQVTKVIWLDGLTTLFMGCAAIGILLAFALVNYGVIARYFFNAAPTWVDDTVGYLLVFVVMCASARNLRKVQHLYVDILTSIVGKNRPQLRRVFELWGHCSVILFSGLMIYSSLESIRLSIDFGMTTTDNVQIPVHYLLVLLPLGASLMILVSVVAIYQGLREFRKGGAI